MTFSSLRALSVSPLPPPGLRNSALARRGVIFVKKDEQPRIRLKQPNFVPSLSRRDAVSLLSSTLLTNFLVTETAEARASRLENKKRAIEKLEKLRTKAGKAKEKTELGSNEDEKSAPSLSNSFPVPTIEANLKTAISHPSSYILQKLLQFTAYVLICKYFLSLRLFCTCNDPFSKNKAILSLIFFDIAIIRAPSKPMTMISWIELVPGSQPLSPKGLISHYQGFDSYVKGLAFIDSYNFSCNSLNLINRICPVVGERGDFMNCTTLSYNLPNVINKRLRVLTVRSICRLRTNLDPIVYCKHKNVIYLHRLTGKLLNLLFFFFNFAGHGNINTRSLDICKTK
ncbi:hypothetical protein IEQ34_021135 [Dendrobium chrysotoxum]|uniref:Uncharacterized protein n=1 Tax=Dendrobium chrysotoxum TaxID=161865 RepID=A0AAV7G455_DENCH|nr:hypothetical protein IEQ34_021135 [Dendrobium chrysotoxum]